MQSITGYCLHNSTWKQRKTFLVTKEDVVGKGLSFQLSGGSSGFLLITETHTEKNVFNI